MAKKVWTPAARKAFAEKMAAARRVAIKRQLRKLGVSIPADASEDLGKLRALRASLKRKRRANPDAKTFRDLSIGDSFDFVDPSSHRNSFYKRVKKTSARGYVDDDGIKYQVGSIKAKVYHVERGTHENPGRAAVHTQKFDRTVRKVKKSLRKYHRKGNAYAIAESTLGKKRSILKRHRRGNPAEKFVVAARERSGPYFFVTGKTDTMLASSETKAHRFATLASARTVANMLAGRVPQYYRVTVHRAS